MVLAAGRPISYLRFLWGAFRFPPVARRLCHPSREIPMAHSLTPSIGLSNKTNPGQGTIEGDP